MRKAPALWPRLIQLLLVLAVPVVLLVADLRIVTGHWFVRWEYGKAGFPPDPFGLTIAERTHLAEVSVDYLATNADISLLGDLQFPEGQAAFNERELRHMADVQAVYGGMMTAGIVAALVLLASTALLLASSHARWRAPIALLRGSLLTLGLLATVGATMLLSWGEFFTTFHRLFFEGETWIFPYTDTLIRLFPIRFWMDVGATTVGLMVVEAIALAAFCWVWAGRLRPSGET
jgi:integral membrane protein (TIGR01906 family)